MNELCEKNLKDNNEKLTALKKMKPIMYKVLEVIIGIIFIYIGVLNPTIENNSIMNSSIIKGKLVSTEIASHYTQEEKLRMSNFEMKKHGIYEFTVNGQNYTVKDHQNYYKVKKTRTIYFNIENPSECKVKTSYFKVLPFSLLGLLLILHVCFPNKMNYLIDKFLSASF